MDLSNRSTQELPKSYPGNDWKAYKTDLQTKLHPLMLLTDWLYMGYFRSP